EIGPLLLVTTTAPPTFCIPIGPFEALSLIFPASSRTWSGPFVVSISIVERRGTIMIKLAVQPPPAGPLTVSCPFPFVLVTMSRNVLVALPSSGTDLHVLTEYSLRSQPLT